MSQRLAVDDNLKHPPSKSEDTVPKSGTSRESCKDDNVKHPLSKNEGMISENKDDKLNHPPSKIEELVPKNGTTLPKEESESGKDSSKNVHESEDSWYDLSQSFMTNLNDSQDCESPGPTHSEGVEQEKSKMSDTLHRDQLSVQQQHDEELQPLIAGALTEDESKDVPVCFYFKNNILMRKWRPPDAPLDEEWRIYHQIVVPRTYRREILSIAHEMPFAGHLGVNKTYHRILHHFYWPKLKSDVAKFCKTCHSCQMVGKPNQNIPAAPLKPIPAFEEPFSRVIIDCVGPLPKSRAGHQYILTIMCASTRFPEAIPLRNIKARTVLQALLKFFTLFGLPKEIQSDQGSNFMSTVFQQMLYELGIDQIKSSAYHPESQGALERFHQTLKNMLKTYCYDNERDWDEGIPFVMFAARESLQESLGFSPFELVFGHTVRGPLKLLKEKWLSDPGEDIHLLDYVSRFKDRLHGACELAQENLRHSQKKLKAWYDKTTVKREFKPGDKVLVFLPVSGQPLQARFQGPYVIERKVSDTDYVILTPDKRKSKRVCHINMMKRYYEREDCDISKDESVHDVNSNTNDTGDQVCIINADHELSNDEIKANNVPDMCIKLQNSDVLKNLGQKLSHLDHKEKSEMKSLIYEYACLFSDDPTRTNLIEHDVDVGDATPIKQHPYRVNPRKRQHLRDEVRYMLDHDIIEPSNSEWSSPCILVPKPDGGYRFCTDYRKVNAVTRTDSYPIPRIDDCIDRIGKATYVSKFDLLKGYWEIPLTERARKISAFVTPDGLFQYKVMPFASDKPYPLNSFDEMINKFADDSMSLKMLKVPNKCNGFEVSMSFNESDSMICQLCQDRASFINPPPCFVEILAPAKKGVETQNALNAFLSSFSGAFTHATILESCNFSSQEDFLSSIASQSVPSVAITLLFAVKAQSLFTKAKSVLSQSPWQCVSLPEPLEEEIGFDTEYYVHTKLPLPLIGLRSGTPGSGVQITTFVEKKESYEKMVEFYQNQVDVSPVEGTTSKAGILSNKFALSPQSEFIVAFYPGLKPVKINTAYLCFEVNETDTAPTEGAVHDPDGNTIEMFSCLK
ncbi:hypothetical protein HOLleu_15710 [Holothuria leucospilota]|uniref:Integrase catalytic domain-containing protein n=1 Tax=Holothuria leucospilota TaxID=206669 RepID=A0A9Q1H7B4_HOLLE|nr:hypothetical protein HOLleu_15710 [Holothuria leucospilota]